MGVGYQRPHEIALAVKAAIGGEDVSMRIEIEEITEAVDHDDRTGDAQGLV